MTEEMNATVSDSVSSVSWKTFLLTTSESLLTFYLATFCFGMLIMHRSTDWMIDIIAMSILYVFIIVACSWRVFKKLSIATVMLIIPIAPFLALAIVISMIPVLQLFK